MLLITIVQVILAQKLILVHLNFRSIFAASVTVLYCPNITRNRTNIITYVLILREEGSEEIACGFNGSALTLSERKHVLAVGDYVGI